VPRRGIPSGTKTIKRPIVRKVKKKQESSSVLADRLLGLSAPISIRELLTSYPKSIDATIRRLRMLKSEPKQPKVLPLFAESGEIDDEDEVSSSGNESDTSDESYNPLPYVLCSVNSHHIPLFIDSGADHSLISSQMVDKLDQALVKLTRPLLLTPASGAAVQSTHAVDLRLVFSDKFKVSVRFYVLKDCAVPILFGRNAIQAFKAILNYNEETSTLHHKDLSVELQLCSRASVQQELFDSDFSLDAATGGNISQVLVAVQNEYLTKSHPDSSFVGVLTTADLDTASDALDARFNDSERHQFSHLLFEFRHLYPRSLNEIPGMKGVAYSLEIPPHLQNRPLTTRLRRYAPREKEIIEAELKVMLEGNIVVPSKSPWVSRS
jgi:hypothetical protein